jgi:hypothetical protein
MHRGFILIGLLAFGAHAAKAATPPSYMSCEISDESRCRGGVCKPERRSFKVSVEPLLYTYCDKQGQCTAEKGGLLKGEDFAVFIGFDRTIAEVGADLNLFSMVQEPQGVLISHGRCREAPSPPAKGAEQ